MEDTIILYPSPGRGHLMAMVELGIKILKHYPSLSITIIISSPPQQRASITPYISAMSDSNPSISFHDLPVIPLPPHFTTSSSYNPVLYFEFAELNNPNLHRELLNLSGSSKLIAIVVDFYCSCAIKVTSRLELPTYFFFPGGANALATFLYLPVLDKTVTKSFKDLDELIHVPGVPPIPAKHMPTGMLDRNSKVYSYFLETAKQITNAAAGLIRNTFEMLEPRAIKAISEGKCVPDGPTPPLYCIGPLIAASDHTGGEECLRWLDSQPTQSVLFLSFGSMGIFSSKQLKEMALALERSGVGFLWVVRNPPPDDEAWQKQNSTTQGQDPSIESLLPEGFLGRNKGRGLVVKSWAPQVAVLNHSSVGGFVTHCGWNSILEGVCAGVPMLAWPLYAEQKLNRVFLVEEAKLGVAVVETYDGFVSADELESRAKELMFSDTGKAIRDRVLAIRDGAMKALDDGGTQPIALAKLVNSFKQGIQKCEI